MQQQLYAQQASRSAAAVHGSAPTMPRPPSGHHRQEGPGCAGGVLLCPCGLNAGNASAVPIAVSRTCRSLPACRDCATVPGAVTRGECLQLVVQTGGNRLKLWPIFLVHIIYHKPRPKLIFVPVPACAPGTVCPVQLVGTEVTMTL